MFNLKKLLKGDPSYVTISKEETDILTYVLCHKNDFETWFSEQHPKHNKIRFVFYYPSAIDLYYDEFKLFSVFFKRAANDAVIFHQFKRTQLTEDSLKTTNWKPFKDAIVDYLTMAQDRNTDFQFKKFKALHDYQQLCNGEGKVQEAQAPFYSLNIESARLTNQV